MIKEGCAQDARDDRKGLLESCRENEREELGLVADFSERHDPGRYEESFHRMSPGRIETNDHKATPANAEAMWSKVSPIRRTTYAMAERPSMLT
jgi:hypothetical protein